MFWPGLGDPAKRRKTLKFLGITAAMGLGVFMAGSLIQAQLSLHDPLKVCINDKDTPFKISATLELYVDKQKAEIPAKIGFVEGGCQMALFTLANDGIIYVEWEEEYPFEIGHFLWVWDFPLRDMVESKSKVLVNGVESEQFIHAPLVNGYHYRAEFVSKAYDESKDKDFLPPDM